MNQTGFMNMRNKLKILHLTLKREWFDMIASGIKKEEYRGIKEYWNTRLNKEYDVILFRNGYNRMSPEMMVELKSIKKGTGNKDWGAPNEEVYVLELGKILYIDMKDTEIMKDQ